VVEVEILGGHMPGGTEVGNKETVGIVGVSAEVRTGYFPNESSTVEPTYS